MEHVNQLPKSFDVHVYRDNNPDLSQLSEDELIFHYHRHGKEEGRVCSRIITQDSFTKLFPSYGDVLEIGQLDRPLSAHAKNIDIKSREDLVKAYTHDPHINVARLTPVHYVIKDTRDWGITDSFDAVISSHNIEHAPCLVSFLRNIEHALRKGGLVYLIIPDYRYCFDRTKFPSTILDVLDAFYTKRDKPSVANLLEYSLLSGANDTVRFWNEKYEISDQSYFALTTEQITSVLERDIDQYHDSHCWKFTPDHFEYITEQLHALGLTSLKPIRVYPTLRHQLQFFAVLQKSYE